MNLNDKILEYIESVFVLRTRGKNCLCPIDNPIIQELLNDETLYTCYITGDINALKASINEVLGHYDEQEIPKRFYYQLDNQMVGNWLYDYLPDELDIPVTDEEW